ncbi:hypothetical protein [Bartonella bovis]|uniref:hypothetical protein n=1 Tax=Bartonella bovis TaxID=155194 RepID=UPI00039C33E8|nr:hypothetical protein [Bartonella bovis]
MKAAAKKETAKFCLGRAIKTDAIYGAIAGSGESSFSKGGLGGNGENSIYNGAGSGVGGDLAAFFYDFS